MWLYLIDFCGVLLMAVLMNNFHAVLILKGLTTNEDMNKHRYAYLPGAHTQCPPHSVHSALSMPLTAVHCVCAAGTYATI